MPVDFTYTMYLRYRESLCLSPLPHIDEKTPIMPSQKTGQALYQNSLDSMVEEAFDLLNTSLVKKEKKQPAHAIAIAIASASSPWLRHTGATQALGEVSKFILAEELGYSSIKFIIEVCVAPAHRDPIKKGA